VFADPAEKSRLERLLHPMVHAARARQMEAAARDPQVVAFVWDTPLLLEAGLGPQCDAIVFVDTPLERRLAQVKARSGWDAAELLRREKSQMPLDTKRSLSDHVITNTADAAAGHDATGGLRGQVQRVLSQVLNGSTRTPATGQ
jgi:dephospho-CoA kinase